MRAFVLFCLVLLLTVGLVLHPNHIISFIGQVLLGLELIVVAILVWLLADPFMEMIHFNFIFKGDFVSAELLCRTWMKFLAVINASPHRRIKWIRHWNSDALTLGKFNECEKALRNALQLAESEQEYVQVADLQSALGYTLFYLGKMDEADALTLKALEYLRHRLHADKSEPVKGVNVPEKLQSIPSASLLNGCYLALISAVYARLAVVESKRDQAEMMKLAKEYLELSALQATESVGQGQLGEAYLLAGDIENAERLIEAHVRFAGDNYVSRRCFLPGAYHRLGKLRLAQERFEEAAQAYDRALLEDSKLRAARVDRWEYLYGKAQAMAGLGKHREAQKLLEECIALREQYFGTNHPRHQEVLDAHAREKSAL